MGVFPWGVFPWLTRVAVGVALLVVAGCAGVDTPVAWQDLKQWEHDDQAAALATFMRSCGRFTDTLKLPPRAGSPAQWRAACLSARTVPPGNAAAARRFFENTFVPLPLGGGDSGLFTGYYESSLRGSRTRHGPYTVPLYRLPTVAQGQTLPRSRIAAGALAGKGLELLWVDDPVEAFFLEIQGSGRVEMDDGSVVSLGFAGKNGHSYVPIGRVLVEKGVASAEEMNAPLIRQWLYSHPEEAQAVMNRNPSYVFFRQRPLEDGPRGAANVPLSAGRSLAVDPAYVPLGVPLWLDAGPDPLTGAAIRRLVVAQDTGGAIKGAVRGDLFWGHGDSAERAAGLMKARGRFYMLAPR